MIVLKQIGQNKSWVLADGKSPLQFRVLQAADISGEHHLHQVMFEFFYVIKGSLIILVNGELIHLQSDDLLFVQPGESHLVKKVSDDLLLFLVMPPPVAGDKIMV